MRAAAASRPAPIGVGTRARAISSPTTVARVFGADAAPFGWPVSTYVSGFEQLGGPRPQGGNVLGFGCAGSASTLRVHRWAVLLEETSDLGAETIDLGIVF
jgi:hypothetical protein